MSITVRPSRSVTDMDYKIVIQYDAFQDEDVVLLAREKDGVREVAQVEWVAHDRGRPSEPAFRFWSEGPRRNSFLSAFVDAAWEFGIRPAAIEDQRNQVKAMADHLDDLRRVAFKGLKIDG
jgi:hypothetical protein